MANCFCDHRVSTIRDEFQWKNFGFHHHKIDDFCRSRWQTSERSVIYLLFRWIWFLFFYGAFAAIVVFDMRGGKAFIFLTNWGIFFCMISNLYGLILALEWHYDLVETKNIRNLPRIVKHYWFFHEISTPLAFTISIIYWVFLFGDKPIPHPILNFVIHSVNSVFMMIDFWIVAVPYRLLHTPYLILLAKFYGLFSYCYHLAGGTDEYEKPFIYSILHWKYPEQALGTCCGVTVLYSGTYIVLFFLYKFKQNIRVWYCNVPQTR